MLIEDEVARREQKKFALRMRRAAFRTSKTLEQFDFDRLPQLNRALIHDLAGGRYLGEHAPVLIVGPCGTGKSHLAQALGHCAVRQGVDVLFYHLHPAHNEFEYSTRHWRLRAPAWQLNARRIADHR